jgi:hypothetical protein
MTPGPSAGVFKLRSIWLNFYDANLETEFRRYNLERTVDSSLVKVLNIWWCTGIVYISAMRLTASSSQKEDSLNPVEPYIMLAMLPTQLLMILLQFFGKPWLMLNWDWVVGCNCFMQTTLPLSSLVVSFCKTHTFAVKLHDTGQPYPPSDISSMQLQIWVLSITAGSYISATVCMGQLSVRTMAGVTLLYNTALIGIGVAYLILRFARTSVWNVHSMGPSTTETHLHWALWQLTTSRGR